DELRITERRIVAGDESDLASADETLLPPPGMGSREGELRPGVPRDERAQLPSRIPAGPEDPDREFMHAECIYRHGGDVKRESRKQKAESRNDGVSYSNRDRG